VGIVGHVHIGDGAQLGAQAGIMNDVEAGATVMGSPSRNKGDYLRAQAALAKLPELLKRVKELERQIEKLEAKS